MGFCQRGPERLFDICSTCTTVTAEEIRHIAEISPGRGCGSWPWPTRRRLKTRELTLETLKSDLIFAGLQGMMDPPRPEVIGAIEGCRKAGIRVIMITGDHAVTARAIAEKLGSATEDRKSSPAGSWR